MREDAPQRTHELRRVFDALLWVVRTGSPWRYLPHDFPPHAAAVRNNFGVLLYERRQYGAAASEFTEPLGLSPNHVETLSNLGLA